MGLIEKTWDDPRLKRDRLLSLQEVMRREKVGALYLTELVSVRYILNLRIPGGAVFVPVAGEPIALVRSMDEGYVRLAHSDVRPRRYRVEPSDPDADEKALKWADELTGLMAEFGVAGERLGIDSLDPIGFTALSRRAIPLVNAERLLQLAKSIKTQDEILIYKELGKLYTKIMRVFRDQTTPGTTEEDLSAFIYAKVIELGAEGLLQINVCSGEHMNPWRRWPTERKLRDGDLVGLDLHVYGPGGYIFDSSRTYLCGSKNSDKQRDRYQRAHEYINAVTGLLQPGVAIADVKARLPQVPEKFQQQLYSFHIAHSNGLTPGEYPNIMKHQRPVDDTIKEGQVLSVDCYFGEVGDDVAVKLEEQVLITAKGPVKMADMPYDDRLLGRIV
jgi:Xaa-Pro aminopeptidase